MGFDLSDISPHMDSESKAPQMFPESRVQTADTRKKKSVAFSLDIDKTKVKDPDSLNGNFYKDRTSRPLDAFEKA